MYKFYFLILVLIVSVYVFPSQAYAARYKVTPRIIDREVQQRDIFSETVSITNNETHNINLYATVNTVSVDEVGDIVDFAPPSMSDNKKTVTSWIAITRGRITLSSGETKKIPINFKINPKAESGEYHAFIGFGSGNNLPTAEQQVRNGQAPGIVVVLSVDAKKTEFLKLGKFAIDKFVTKPDNTAISYTLDNPGSAELVPTGEIIFYDGKGVEVGSTPVNPDKISLAPGQETTYEVPAPTDGLLGQYKAFLTIDYGTQQLASVNDTAFFYVFPWQKILILFLLFLTVAIVLTIFLHLRFGKDSHQHDGFEEIPLFIKDDTSENKEHDINLKK